MSRYGGDRGGPLHSTKVYIGNLPNDVSERELEDLFYKFGRFKYIDIKASNRGPAYAFIEYEDTRDAGEAVRRRDGVEFAGQRIRVEMARGSTMSARENFRPPRSTGYRVLVKGLPKTASWQDLKDHIRLACKPNYTDVRTGPDGTVVGVVEFDTYEDMRKAIRELDDSEFKNPRYDRGFYVRLIEDTPEGRANEDKGRSRSRSPRRASRSPADRERGRDERDRSRERRDSPRRDSPDRERGRKADRSASRSRSRSRSRS